MNCQKCGNELNKNEMKCPHCGYQNKLISGQNIKQNSVLSKINNKTIEIATLMFFILLMPLSMVLTVLLSIPELCFLAFGIGWITLTGLAMINEYNKTSRFNIISFIFPLAGLLPIIFGIHSMLR